MPKGGRSYGIDSYLEDRKEDLEGFSRFVKRSNQARTEKTARPMPKTAPARQMFKDSGGPSEGSGGRNFAAGLQSSVKADKVQKSKKRSKAASKKKADLTRTKIGKAKTVKKKSSVKGRAR